MWSSGFFNSVNGDRLYNADHMSEMFTGLLTDGVYEAVGNKLAVEAIGGMMLKINTGRGWFGGRWVKNDSAYGITLEPSDATLNRYAAICVRADNSEANRKASPYVKYSAFASSPVKPTMERSDTVKEYCLAYVYIGAGVTKITAVDIEDTRSNTDLCGWVTGLIEQLDSNTMWTQWEAEFRKWLNGLKNLLTDDAETKMAGEILDLQNRLSGGTYTIFEEDANLEAQDDGTFLYKLYLPNVTPSSHVIVSPLNKFHAITYTGCEMEAHSVENGYVAFKAKIVVPADVEIMVINL